MAEPQQSAVDLYTWLDTWCDGEPSTLAERIYSCDAPDDQVVTMALDWPTLDYELDVLQTGKLRPAMGGYPGSAHTEVATALRLALYVDEVVLTSDLVRSWASEPRTKALIRVDRQILGERLELLGSLRPLVERGAIRFEAPQVVSMELDEDLDRVFDQWASKYPANGGTELWWSSQLAFADARRLLGLIFAGLATPLALDEVAESVFHAALAGHEIDGRITGMQKLARVPVPDLLSDVATLVRLRDSAESLNSFRSALDKALQTVTCLPESNCAARRASEILSEVLQRELESVSAEIGRSAAFRTLTAGTRILAFSGLGAWTGAVVAHSPVSGLLGAFAGGVTSATFEALSQGISSLKARSGSKAAWCIATSFRPDD